MINEARKERFWCVRRRVLLSVWLCVGFAAGIYQERCCAIPLLRQGSLLGARHLQRAERVYIMAVWSLCHPFEGCKPALYSQHLRNCFVALISGEWKAFSGGWLACQQPALGALHKAGLSHQTLVCWPRVRISSCLIFQTGFQV